MAQQLAANDARLSALQENVARNIVHIREQQAVVPSGTGGEQSNDAVPAAGSSQTALVDEIKRQLQSEMGLLPVRLLRERRESFVELKHPSGRTAYWNVYSERKSEPQPEGTDFWAVENGWVSVTPMKIDETDPSQFEMLRGIFK